MRVALQQVVAGVGRVDAVRLWLFVVLVYVVGVVVRQVVKVYAEPVPLPFRLFVPALMVVFAKLRKV